MRLQKRTFLLILIAITIITCKKEPSPPSVIMPLQSGNQWIYKTISYTIDSTDTVFGKDTLAVSPDKFLNRNIWFKANEAVDYANEASGLWEKIRGDEHLYLKYPAVKGDEYYIIPAATTVRILSTDTEITVPAGKFKTYAYEFYSRYPYQNYLWATPDVGIVMTEFIDRYIGHHIEKEELSSYHLNK